MSLIIVSKAKEEVFKEFELESTFSMYESHSQYLIREKLIHIQDDDLIEIEHKTLQEVRDEVYIHYLTRLQNNLNQLEKDTSGFIHLFWLFFREPKAVNRHNEKIRLQRILNKTEHPNFRDVFCNKIKIKSPLPLICNYFNPLPEDSFVYLVKHSSPTAKDYLEISRFNLFSKKMVFNMNPIANAHTHFDIQYEARDEEEKNKIFFTIKADFEGKHEIHYQVNNHTVFLSQKAAEDFCKEEYKKIVKKEVS